MNVLNGCEFSGVVRRAFRALGHDAWSCDLLPAEDNSDYHYLGDVLDVIYKPWKANEEYGGGGFRWDLMVAHPPCTHLAVSGAMHFHRKQKEQADEYDHFSSSNQPDAP